MSQSAEFERILRERGRSMALIETPEIALTRSDTLAAIHALKETDESIIGGQVVSFDSDGYPKYEYDIWNAPHWDPQTVTWHDYVSGSHRLAITCVTNYKNPDLESPYFTISTADERKYRELDTKRRAPRS